MRSVRALTEHDARAVYEVARRVYPDTFELSLEDVAANLQPSDNLCFGAWEDQRLVGYLMCWPDFSQIEGREDEPVVFLDEIVALPEARPAVFSLLRALRQGLLARSLENRPIECIHRFQAERLFEEHPRVLAVLGYVLGSKHHYYGAAVLGSL